MAPRDQNSLDGVRSRRRHLQESVRQSSSLESGTYDDQGKDVVSQNDSSQQRRRRSLDPTVSLPLLVFVDMIGVSLVVPLLFQYYKNAGVSSASQRELLSSVFSSSQIVGGIVLGALTDAKILRRKTLLYFSFGGSAMAYFLIAYGNFSLMLFSRVLVGLVKQTMTVSTSIMTHCTDEENRAKYLGRIQSSATAAWIAGPSVGAFLYTIDHQAPALLACGLFLVNMVLASLFLHDIDNEDDDDEDTEDDKKRKSAKKVSFWSNLKTCFSSSDVGTVIVAILLFSWVNRATSYSSMGSFYEDMYGLQPHHRGYIQSYQSVLRFMAQSLLVGPILRWFGGERWASSFAVVVMGLATLMEMQRSLPVFLVALSPAISIASTILQVSLRSLLTHVAPEESIFSVFAALDVLENAAAVTVPFYRTTLFSFLNGREVTDGDSGMEGDPDPMSWAFSGFLHWTIASAVMTYLLIFLAPRDRRKSKRPSADSKEV